MSEKRVNSIGLKTNNIDEVIKAAEQMGMSIDDRTLVITKHEERQAQTSTVRLVKQGDEFIVQSVRVNKAVLDRIANRIKGRWAYNRLLEKASEAGLEIGEEQPIDQTQKQTLILRRW